MPVRKAQTAPESAAWFRTRKCAACHHVPDISRAEQLDLDQWPLRRLGDRLRLQDLATFLGNPHVRYPDGRMPRLPVAPEMARDIAAYLLMWSRPTPDLPVEDPPTLQEIAAVVRRLGARNRQGAATALLRDKGCASCHPGLGATTPADAAGGDKCKCRHERATNHATLEQFPLAVALEQPVQISHAGASVQGCPSRDL